LCCCVVFHRTSNLVLCILFILSSQVTQCAFLIFMLFTWYIKMNLYFKHTCPRALLVRMKPINSVCLYSDNKFFIKIIHGGYSGLKTIRTAIGPIFLLVWLREESIHFLNAFCAHPSIPKTLNFSAKKHHKILMYPAQMINNNYFCIYSRKKQMDASPQFPSQV
jgi:hypothetical protein